jgi:hypothetical protein
MKTTGCGSGTGSAERGKSSGGKVGTSGIEVRVRGSGFRVLECAGVEV